MVSKFSFVFLFAFLLSVVSVSAVELTPEQRARLDALPPNLRSQAMAELQKLKAANAPQTQPVERPEVVKPKDAPEDRKVEQEFQQGTDFTTAEERPEAKVVRRELKQFGYDLFAGAPTTFAPATEIPIPTDYIIGPGDQIRIQFFGKETASYDIYVTRDGVLQVPELGPITVAGQSFSELKAEISRRVASQMIGMEAFISLGELRSIRIFVLGDVNRPGSYTVSALSTMTNALFVSGGVRPIGTLRRIQLKRQGEVVAEMDLYDLLLRGDTSSDARLQPGDVLFVPPVGTLAGVSGEVKRPAIYELAGETSASELVELAGGYTATAFPPISQIERIASTGLKEVVDIDLVAEQASGFQMRDGDVLRIYSTLDRADNIVRLEGLAERPGNYQWREGLRISDIISQPEQLVPDADLNYALVISKDPYTGRISTRSFSFERLFSSDGSRDNLPLYPRDRVIIFDSTQQSRGGLESIVTTLRRQATSLEPQKVVAVLGHVRHAGSYPLDEGMTVGDLIQAAGGYSEEAYTLEAELLRYIDNQKEQRETILVPVDLTSVARGDDLDLQPFDQLLVKRIPEWSDNESIRIEGEVRFPGSYTIERGERLSDVIERAGGLTDLAYPEAAVFLRASLRQAEAAQIAKLRDRLREDLSTARLQDDRFTGEAISTASELLDQLETTEPVGRLVIDLPAILAGESLDGDIMIKGGDNLRIPQKPQSVTIIGSVNYPTSHFYQSEYNRTDYIELSGGLLKRADKRRIYVVRANGRVEVDNRSRFFPNSNFPIYPGDTIVVPIDVDRMKPLRYWGEVSQIIYQLALGAAAVNSF